MRGMTSKREKRERRHKRVRAKIKGTVERPRLSVFRSNRHLWVQLIDDTRGVTVAAANDAEIKGKEARTAEARLLGALIAERAGEKKIKQAVFDRGGYRYHGVIQAVAEGARKAGLRF